MLNPIRKSPLFLISVLFVALVTGCAGQQSQTSQDATLYERLGGKEAITAVVQHLWGVVSKDKRINSYFAHTKPEVFGSQLIDFLCQGAGGPCEYQGGDMHTAHTGMKISSDDFDALAEDIVITLNHFNVPQQEQDEVMGMLGGMKAQVINH